VAGVRERERMGGWHGSRTRTRQCEVESRGRRARGK
jgi:hypothetical protein